MILKLLWGFLFVSTLSNAGSVKRELPPHEEVGIQGKPIQEIPLSALSFDELFALNDEHKKFYAMSLDIGGGKTQTHEEHIDGIAHGDHPVCKDTEFLAR